MRPNYQPPRKKRYFHTKKKKDKRDGFVVKERIEVINRWKHKRLIEEEMMKKRRIR